MNSESMKGHLDALLLAAVERQPGHGYALIERVRALSDGAFLLPEGTVYPALHRLERLGLLESAWSADAPRRLRVYSLTDRGRAVLVQRREEWRAFASGMTAALQGAR